MESISPKLTQEIERRIANGPFRTADELISYALQTMDELQSTAQERLEQELMKGLEGEDIELTRERLDMLKQRALDKIAAGNRP